jgi:hypothetical protein
VSSTLDRTTGLVTITSAGYSWAEPGHQLAVVGSPAERRTWGISYAEIDARLRLLALAAETRQRPTEVLG